MSKQQEIADNYVKNLIFMSVSQLCSSCRLFCCRNMFSVSSYTFIHLNLSSKCFSILGTFHYIILVSLINLITKLHERLLELTHIPVTRASDLPVEMQRMVQFLSCSDSVNWHRVVLLWRAIYNDPIINPKTVPETERDDRSYHKRHQY